MFDSNELIKVSLLNEGRKQGQLVHKTEIKERLRERSMCADIQSQNNSRSDLCSIQMN